jgi:hypothetical protein
MNVVDAMYELTCALEEGHMGAVSVAALRVIVDTAQNTDWSRCSDKRIEEAAKTLDEVVASTRAALADPELTSWDSETLGKIEDHVAHIDSIAESLHIAASAQLSASLALAAVRVLGKEKTP